MSLINWCSSYIFWITFQMIFTLVGPYPENVPHFYADFENIPRLHPSKNPKCISRWSAYNDAYIKYTEFKNKRRMPEEASYTESSSVQVKAVLVPCRKTSANIRQYESNRQREATKKCRQKIAITMRINNAGEMKTQEEFIVIDHILDSVTMHKIRLLNPYVIKIRQEAILQLYGLKFQGVVNAEAREEVINNNQPNFTGCDDRMENPTCGQMLIHGQPIPHSQGFCCSCDNMENVRQRHGILNEFTGNSYSDSGPNCEDNANKPCNRLTPPTAYVNILDNSQTPRRVQNEELHRWKMRSDNVGEGREKHGIRSLDGHVSVENVLPKMENDYRDESLTDSHESLPFTILLNREMHREIKHVPNHESRAKHEVHRITGHVPISNVLSKKEKDIDGERLINDHETSSTIFLNDKLHQTATYIADHESRAKHDVHTLDSYNILPENENTVIKKSTDDLELLPPTSSTISLNKKLHRYNQNHIPHRECRTKYEARILDGHVSHANVPSENLKGARDKKLMDRHEPLPPTTSLNKKSHCETVRIPNYEGRAKHEVRGSNGHVSIANVLPENQKDTRDENLMDNHEPSPSTLPFNKKLHSEAVTSTMRMLKTRKRVYVTYDMSPIPRSVLFNKTSPEGKTEAYTDAIRERTSKEENSIARAEDRKLVKTIERKDESKNMKTVLVARNSDESDYAENGQEYDRLATYNEPVISLQEKNLIACKMKLKNEQDAFKKMKSVKENTQTSSDNKRKEVSPRFHKSMKYVTHSEDRINQDAPSKMNEAPVSPISTSSLERNYIHDVTLSGSEERTWSSQRNIISGDVRMERKERDPYEDLQSVLGKRSFANSKKEISFPAERDFAPETTISRPNAILRSSITDLRSDQLRKLTDHPVTSKLARNSASTSDIANGALGLLPEDLVIREKSTQNESPQGRRKISYGEPTRNTLILPRNSTTANKNSSKTATLQRFADLSTRSVQIETRRKLEAISPSPIASIPRKNHNNFNNDLDVINKRNLFDRKTHKSKRILEGLNYENHRVTDNHVKALKAKAGQGLQQGQKAVLTRLKNVDKTHNVAMISKGRSSRLLYSNFKHEDKYDLENNRFSSNSKPSPRKKFHSRRFKRSDEAVSRSNEYHGRGDCRFVGDYPESDNVDGKRSHLDGSRNSETRVAVSVDIANPDNGRYKDQYAVSRPTSDLYYVHTDGKVGRGRRENSKRRYPGPPYKMQIFSEDNGARTKSYSKYETRESMPENDFDENVNSTFANPYCAAGMEYASSFGTEVHDNPFYIDNDARRSNVDRQIEEKFKRISDALREASDESNIDRANSSAGKTRNDGVPQKFATVSDKILNGNVSGRQRELDQVSQFTNVKFRTVGVSTFPIEEIGKPNESTVKEIGLAANKLLNIRNCTNITEKPVTVIDRFKIVCLPKALKSEGAIIKEETVANAPKPSEVTLQKQTESVTEEPVLATRRSAMNIDYFNIAKRPPDEQLNVTSMKTKTDSLLHENKNNDRQKLSRHLDRNTSFATTISDLRTFEESSKRPFPLRTNMPAALASLRRASLSKKHFPSAPFRSYFQKRLHDISRARHGQRIRSHLPSAFLPDLKGNSDTELSLKNKKNELSSLDNAGFAPGLPTDYRPTEKSAIETIEKERLRSTTDQSLSEITRDDVSPTENLATTVAESSTWQTTRITDQKFRPFVRPVQLFVPGRPKIVLSVDEFTLEDEVDLSTESGSTVSVTFPLEKSSNVASEESKIHPKFHVDSSREFKFQRNAESMRNESFPAKIVVRSPRRWANALPITSPSAWTTVSGDFARMKKFGRNLSELRKLSKVDHETTRRGVLLLGPASADSARSKTPQESNFYSGYRVSSNKYETNNMPEEIFSATDVSDGAMGKFYASGGNAKYSKSNTDKLDDSEMAKLAVPLKSSELRNENISRPNNVEGYLERIYRTGDSSKDLLLDHASAAFVGRSEGTESTYPRMHKKAVKSKIIKEKEQSVSVKKRNKYEDVTDKNYINMQDNITTYKKPSLSTFKQLNDNNDHPWSTTTGPSEILKNTLFHLSQTTEDSNFNLSSFAELNADLLTKTIDKINFAFKNPNIFLRKYNLSDEMKLALLHKLRRSDAFTNLFDPSEDAVNSAVDNSKINGSVDPENSVTFAILDQTFPSERQIGYYDRSPEDTYTQHAATNPTLTFNPTDNRMLFENNYADFNYNDASNEYGAIEAITGNSFGAGNTATSDVSVNENGFNAAEEFRLRRNSADRNVTEQRKCSPAESNPASYQSDEAPNLAEITEPFIQLEKKILPGKLYYDGSRSALQSHRGRDKLLKSLNEGAFRHDNDEKMIENEVTAGITRNDASYAAKNFSERILPACTGNLDNRQKDPTMKTSPGHIGVWPVNDILKEKNGESRFDEYKSLTIYDVGKNVWKRKFVGTLNKTNDDYGSAVDAEKVQYNQVHDNSISEFEYSLPKRSFDPSSSFGKKYEEGNLVFMNRKLRFLTDLPDRNIEKQKSNRLIDYSEDDAHKIMKYDGLFTENINCSVLTKARDNDEESEYSDGNINSYNTVEALKGNLRRLLSIQVNPARTFRPSELPQQSIFKGAANKRRLLNKNYLITEYESSNRIQNPSLNSYNQRKPGQLQRTELLKNTDGTNYIKSENTHIVNLRDPVITKPEVNVNEVLQRSDGSSAKKIDKSPKLQEIGLYSNFKNVADELDGTSAFNELSSEKRFHSEIGYNPTPDNKETDVRVGSDADFQSRTATAIRRNLLETKDIKSLIVSRAKYPDEECSPAFSGNKYPNRVRAKAREPIINELEKNRNERDSMNKIIFYEEPHDNHLKFNSNMGTINNQQNAVTNKSFNCGDFDITLKGKLHVHGSLGDMPRSVGIHTIPESTLLNKSHNSYSMYSQSKTLKTSNDISKKIRSNEVPGARLFSHVFNIESVPDALADTADTILNRTGVGARVSHNIHETNPYRREWKNIDLSINPIKKPSIRQPKSVRNIRENVQTRASNNFRRVERRSTVNKEKRIAYNKRKLFKTTTRAPASFPKIFDNGRLISNLKETHGNWAGNPNESDSNSTEIDRSFLNATQPKNVATVPLLSTKVESQTPNVTDSTVNNLTVNENDPLRLSTCRDMNAGKCYKMTTVLQRMDIPPTITVQKSIQDEQVSTVSQLNTETTTSEKLTSTETVQYRSNLSNATTSFPNPCTERNEETATELPTNLVTKTFSNQLQITCKKGNMSNDIQAKNMLAIGEFVKRLCNIVGNGALDNPQVEVNGLRIHVDRFMIKPDNKSNISEDHCDDCATDKHIPIGEGIKHSYPEEEAKNDDPQNIELKLSNNSRISIDGNVSSAKEPKEKLVSSKDDDRSTPLESSFESPVYASGLLETVKGGYWENPSAAVNNSPEESAHASTLLRSDYHPGGRKKDKSFLFHGIEDRHSKSTVNVTDNSVLRTLGFMENQKTPGNNVLFDSEKSTGESLSSGVKTSKSNDKNFSESQRANLTKLDSNGGLKGIKIYFQASAPTENEIMTDDALKYNSREEDMSRNPAERMKSSDWQENKIKLSESPAKSEVRQAMRQLGVERNAERLDKQRQQSTTGETTELETIGRKMNYVPNLYDVGVQEKSLENKNTFQEIRNVEPLSPTEVRGRISTEVESRGFENSVPAYHERIIKKREKTRGAKKRRRKKKKRRGKKKKKKKQEKLNVRNADYTEKWRLSNRHLLAVSEDQEIPLTLTLNGNEERPARGYLLKEHKKESGRFVDSTGKRRRETSKRDKRRPRKQRQIEPDGAQIRGGQDCTDRKHPMNVSQSEYLKSAHCLRFSNLWYSVYKLEEPIMEHVVYLQLYEKRTLSDGSTHWNDLTRGSIVRLGTFNTHHTDDEGTIAFAYNEVNAKQGRQERYLDPAKDRLLIPSTMASGSGFKNQGASGEYLVVEADAINENGSECDKAGVGFAAFVGQANRCGRVRGTCLKNQPLAYWRHDMEARVAGQPGCYFLSNFASVPTDPIKYNVSGSGSREYLGLEYDSPHVSTIDIEVGADYNAAVKAETLGRISEIYVDNTDLGHTTIIAIIKNTGPTSSSYQLRITDCPKGLPITWTTAKSPVQIITPQLRSRMTIDIPGQLSSREFYCSLELVSRHSELVAMRRIKIRKMDRCLCVWHCVCTCVGSDSGQGCQPMSLEHYHAAGFRGPVPVLSSDSFVLSDTVRDVLFTAALAFLLLIMGMTKWLIGICVPTIRRWGLDAILASHKMSKYFEKELKCRCVVTDKSDVPVHPDTRQKNIRICSRKMEFFLNLTFFIIYPVMISCSCIKKLCQNHKQRYSFPKQSKTSQTPEEDEDRRYICMRTYKDYRDSKIEAEDTKYVMKELRKSQESLRDYMKHERNYYCKRKHSPRH